MDKYRITFELRSALATPLCGDTLFGHVCWGISAHEGDASVEKFLKEYDAGLPPLVLSNAFPEGTLPVPMLSPSRPDPGLTVEKLDILKNIRKIRHIPSEYFTDGNTVFSEKWFVGEFDHSKGKQPRYKRPNQREFPVLRAHNSINRETGTTGAEGGGFYSALETWHGVPDGTDNASLEVYAFTTLTEERLGNLMAWAVENGYGADKSTGKGRMDVTDVVKAALPEKGNRCMALGHFATPRGVILTDLRADVFTRFGKLGGDYVLTKGNPFKKPAVLFAEGATFDAEKNSPDYVGTLLSGVHPDPGIRQHAFAPVIRYEEAFS